MIRVNRTNYNKIQKQIYCIVRFNRDEKENNESVSVDKIHSTKNKNVEIPKY